MAPDSQLLQRLLAAESGRDLKNLTDSLLLSPGHESAKVLSEFFRLTPVVRSRVYIARSLKKLTDYKMLRRLAHDFLEDFDSDVRMEILKSSAASGHPLLTPRWTAQWDRIKKDKKKIVILQFLMSCGTSCSAGFFLERYSKESRQVRFYILLYLAGLPALTAEQAEISMQHCLELASLAVSAEEERLLHELLPSLTRSHSSLAIRARKSLTKTRMAIPDVLHRLACPPVHFSERFKPKKIIEAMLEEECEKQKAARMDGEALLKLETEARALIKEFDSEYKASIHPFMKHLVWLGTTRMTVILINCLDEAEHFNVKQILLDYLPLFPQDENSLKLLEGVCSRLLLDTDHIRIFDSLVRVLILFYGRQGLEKIQKTFELSQDEGRRSAVLSGIISAIHDWGFDIGLKSAGVLHLNLILGLAVEDLRKTPSAVSPLYVNRVFRLMELTGLDTYAAEMLELEAELGMQRDILRCLVRLGGDMGLGRTVTRMEEWSRNIPMYWKELRNALDEVGKKNTGRPVQIGARLTELTLAHPLTSAEAVRFLARTRQFHLTAQVLHHLHDTRLEMKSVLLDYFEALGLNENCDEIWCIFKEGDALIRRRSAQMLLKIGKKEYLRRLFRHYLSKVEGIEELNILLSGLDVQGEAVRNCFLVLSSFNQHRGIAALADVIKDLAWKYFLIAGPSAAVPEAAPSSEPAEIGVWEMLPKDTGRSLHTAEGFFAMLSKEILENKANPENYNLFTTLEEYRYVTYSLMHHLISERLRLLWSDATFKHSLSEIFKNAYNFTDFFQKEKCWPDIHFDRDLINALIRKILEGNEANLLESLDDLKKIIHFLAMVLHDRKHYGLNNPLKLPLELFAKESVVTLLQDLEKKFERLSDETLPLNFHELEEIRRAVIQLSDFYVEYLKVRTPL